MLSCDESGLIKNQEEARTHRRELFYQEKISPPFLPKRGSNLTSELEKAAIYFKPDESFNLGKTSRRVAVCVVWDSKGHELTEEEEEADEKSHFNCDDLINSSKKSSRLALAHTIDSFFLFCKIVSNLIATGRHLHLKMRRTLENRHQPARLRTFKWLSCFG